MCTSTPSGSHRSEGPLTSRIKMAKPIEKSTPADQEDWPEYLRMQYPGATIIYDSGDFGDVQIKLPPHPNHREDSDLMAHYLWDSSLLLSQLIAGSKQQNNDPGWSVEGQHVLELGSGTGLVGIICALAGAESTVLTDYPSPEILENIRKNVETNVAFRQRTSLRRPADSVSVEAHKWGELEETFAKSNAHKFTRVLATGCLWLPEQHQNIARSMKYFLTGNEKAEVWAVSGFFLGRERLAEFFDISSREGLNVRDVFEQNAVGDRREWMADRGWEDGKDIMEQGWLLVVVLCQRGDQSS